MILSVHRHVHDAIAAAIAREFGVADVPPFGVETPPNRALGDLAVTVAFHLARVLKKPPRAIAQALAGSLDHVPGIARVTVAPNGYLNIHLERADFLRQRLHGTVAPVKAPADKTVVEHTAINPNKAAHIGHLRNATLGDTLGRVLRFRGTTVEVQNYIDDTGVQVADVIVGFRELEHRSPADVAQLANTTRFDYYCWDLYSRVTEWYDGDKTRLEVRARTLHELEQGGNETAEIGAIVVKRIVQAHLATMARLGVRYDLLTHEGDILRLHFWAHAFDILKQSGAVFLQTEGKLAGCWVMPIDDGTGTADGEPGESGETEAAESSPDANESANRLKVIVRSNGVVTYVGKDIANQFWKFGLLGRDFHYQAVGPQWDHTILWSTTSLPGDPTAPPFGHATRIYNVIDSRQMYLQALLSQALRTLGYPREADNSVHFSYEMVGLSHATARELGYAPEAGGAGKPFVEVSGRRGLGVKVDDLLDLLGGKASDEVTKRNPDLPDDERTLIANQIAVAAIRYFMLKFSRGKLIVFDIAEALSFDGETGPYLQYAVVRANNIFQKLRERDGVTEADVLRDLDVLPADELTDDSDHGLWALVLEAARLDDVVEQVVRSLEFSVLAKYAFTLAQRFNAFYHQSSILNEEDPARKRWRAAGVAYFRDQLTRTLDLMGIAVPSRM